MNYPGVVGKPASAPLFDEEVCSVLETLLIERVQNGMAGSVGRCTSALRQLFSYWMVWPPNGR